MTTKQKCTDIIEFLCKKVYRTGHWKEKGYKETTGSYRPEVRVGKEPSQGEYEECWRVLPKFN